MATYKPKNIMITGAAGFIGSHFANRLVRVYPEYKIVAVDKLDYPASIKNMEACSQSPHFKFLWGDITDADHMREIILTECIDTIIHFAAQTHVDRSFGDPLSFTHNNVHGTHVLLDTSKFTGQIKRFIHVSTDEVYGETEGDEPSNESSVFQPTNPYAATKAGAELLARAYYQSYGLPVIITRGNNVYGPNQYPEKLIPKFILLAKYRKPLPIHGDGSSLRSFLYCEDVAAAFDTILHKGETGQIYNIGTENEKSVLDVAKNICNILSLDFNSNIKFVPDRPFNDKRYLINSQKLKDLGWSETTTFAEGLKSTVDWYLENATDWWGSVHEILGLEIVSAEGTAVGVKKPWLFY